MSLVSHDLREGTGALLQRLSSPPADSKPAGPTKASTRLLGAQTSEATLGPYRVVSDEPRSVGGNESAPTPSSLFVAAIGFAENVIFARQAALHEMDFEPFETDVEAQWDRKGMFGIGGADPSITDVLIETRIVTSARPEEVAELLLLTHSRSPLTATIAKAAKIRRRLVVNGEEVRT